MSLLRRSVVDGFVGFSTPLEGLTDWLYCDVLGLVTIGMGNLVDPPALLAGLTFVRHDGSVASASEVSSAWLAVKNRFDLRLHGGGAYKPVTTIRATRESIMRLVYAKLDAFAVDLALTYQDLANWPADAQLGLLSMAWAMGPRFAEHHAWPTFTEACEHHDWETAGDNCKMHEAGNPGLVPRNRADAILFRNAALSDDPEVLHWPSVLTVGGAVVAKDDQPIYAAPDPEDLVTT